MTALRLSARVIVTLLAAGLLAGCTRDMGDLKDWVSQVKSRPAGEIEPLPEIEPYESFAYSAQDLRSPFTRGRAPGTQLVGEDCPDPSRTRQALEQYSLDALAMVGTFTKEGRMWGLIRDPEGVIHRVQRGNYIGRNDGTIVNITPTEIAVVEMVPNNRGGCIERQATLALDTD